MKIVRCGNVLLYDLQPVGDSFRTQVLAGLSARPKTLPCKFFYDSAGAALFDEITELPEYYPTRLEHEIMEDMSPVIAEVLGERVRLVEFGSGSSQKTRWLLSALRSPSSYVPIDLSRSYLVPSAGRIQADYPDLAVQPVCADYSQPLELPPEREPSATTVAYFPGSTIGNFVAAEAVRFLRMVADLVGPDGALLLGVDRYPADHHGRRASPQRHKTVDDLRRAYNDSAGVTARFNLNLLERMKRDLGADVDVSSFRHEAIFDAGENRIEMRLISTVDQVIRVSGHVFSLHAGEPIVTELCHKYDTPALERIAVPAGFPMSPAHKFADDNGWFVVHLFLRPGHPGAGGTR